MWAPSAPAPSPPVAAFARACTASPGRGWLWHGGAVDPEAIRAQAAEQLRELQARARPGYPPPVPTAWGRIFPDTPGIAAIPADFTVLTFAQWAGERHEVALSDEPGRRPAAPPR